MTDGTGRMKSDLNIGDIANLAKLQSQSSSSVLRHPSSAKKIDKAAEDFEAVFLTQMMEQMFPEEWDPMGSQESDDVYRDWMIEQYGKQIAKAGGIGIASHVKAELLKMQEMAQGGGEQAVAVPPKFFNIGTHPAPQISIER